MANEKNKAQRNQVTCLKSQRTLREELRFKSKPEPFPPHPGAPTPRMRLSRRLTSGGGGSYFPVFSSAPVSNQLQLQLSGPYLA